MRGVRPKEYSQSTGFTVLYCIMGRIITGKYKKLYMCVKHAPHKRKRKTSSNYIAHLNTLDLLDIG